MAETEKASFPMLPEKHWWALRDRFKASIPGVVSPSYIAATLNMQEQSARANVILPLRMLGLIDDENRTDQTLAIAWRDDKSYAQVCGEILRRVYPAELIDAVPNPVEDRDAAARWFANRTGAGSDAVRKMATLYAILAQPDLVQRSEKKAEPSRSRRKDAPSARKEPEERSKEPPRADRPGSEEKAPGIAINLQIHISSDATPDQIDAIFASMARHIYRKQ